MIAPEARQAKEAAPVAARTAGTLLCVVNFPSGTGFAWDFIESLYADVADRLLDRSGMRTLVAYPRVEGSPRTLEGSAARPLELEVDLNDPGALLRLARLIRRESVSRMYLSDRPAWHPAYALLRSAGVDRIVVHDHTSGARTPPRGLKRGVKRATRAIPGMLADVVIGVSDYVARRKREVDLVPDDRVIRIWNAVKMPDEERSDGRRVLRDRLDVPSDVPVVACACRASREKGVEHLLRAFETVSRELDPGQPSPLLVYLGDGPDLERWEAIRQGLSCSDRVLFTGYRDDADEIVGSADVAVVPSVWQEAFGLSALEPMSRGVPVIASSVGGLTEVVEDGVTGLLVPPGDERALADALHRLLAGPEERRRMGRKGRDRARASFGWDRLVDEVSAVLEPEAA